MDGDAPSLPQPCPRSPPEYPDLYGRRREFTKVQMLEREIGFLQEELKSVEGFQPASRCCEEVVDFSLGNSDPLIPTYQKRSASRGYWKWLWWVVFGCFLTGLCGISWLNFSWICCCCYAVCPPDLKLPGHCTCDSRIHIPECRCSNHLLRKWSFSSCCHRPDCNKPNRHCRNCNCLLCCPCGGNSSCCCFCFSRPKCSWCYHKCSCLKLQLCFSCNGLCCNPCYYCY